jgi:hypothetical protein
MSIQHAGYIITVVQIAYGWYKYYATGQGKPPMIGKVQAYDEADAYDNVCMIIDEEQ